MSRGPGVTQEFLHAQRQMIRVRTRQGRGGIRRPRSRAEEVRSRRTLILMLLTCALGTEIAMAALTSPLLGINRITLHGVEGLPLSEVAEAAQKIALPPGSNLLRAPVIPMKRRLKALPWVKSARVSLRFPHGLQAQVLPRAPEVQVQVGAHSYEVDGDAVFIRPIRPAQAAVLPRVAIARAGDPVLGAALPEDGLAAAIRIYRNARQQPMVRIAKIEVDQNQNMCLNMRDGICIRIGQPDELAAKMDSVQRIYQVDPQIAHRMVAIDLSYPRLPACTPRPVTPTASVSPADSSRVPLPASAGSNGASSL